MNVTRKSFWAAAAVAAATVTAAVVPAASAARVPLFTHSVGPAQPSTPIQHVVVIYMENHSFDSLLGFWCDDHRARCQDANGNFVGMPSSVTLSNGAVISPVPTAGDVVPVIQHTTADQDHAINGGRMDGWGRIPGCGAPSYRCVTGWQPRQMPNLSQLADTYAIGDEVFSMQDSPSWFGHMYAVAATTDGFTGANPTRPKGGTAGEGWGCDSNDTADWVSDGVTERVPSCVPDPALLFHRPSLPNGGAFKPSPVPYVPTIMDRLNAAGLTWKLYGAQCANEKVAGSGLETCTKVTTSSSLGYGWAVCPTFAECLYDQSAGMASDSEFLSDASSGLLPSFSLVTPGNAADSEHNGFSMTQGDDWLGQQVAAVMNGPDWDSTAVFITWDDCGCFYDQVAPGVNPDGTPQGPRVPLLIVSPYARPGYTDTTPTTFAGILAYTERNFGLSALGVNDARAYDFSNAFDYSQTPLKPVRMVTRPVPRGDHIDWAQAQEDS